MIFWKLCRLPNALLLALLCVPITVARADGPACPFDTNKLEFVGTPIEQARCLLRPVMEFGRLGQPLATLPAPLENLIGQPVTISRSNLQLYLTARNIADAAIGGSVTNVLLAKYFVIHDTSTPNYHEKPFPDDINNATWRFNDLARASSSKAAHFFVNRLGESIATHPITLPWRATKFESVPPKEEKHGVFIHTELIEPRRSDPDGHAGNDGIAPAPGFTEAQLDRLALLYIVASVEHGQWLVPAFHATVDAGIPNGHDDPQNFDLALWAHRLNLLLGLIEPTNAQTPGSLHFEVSLPTNLVTSPQTGRLFVILGRKEKPEPRAALGSTGLDAPYVLARDINSLAPGGTTTIDKSAITFPITNLAELPAGDYFVQALLDSNKDLRSVSAPGNLYSDVRKIHLTAAQPETIKFELRSQIPPEELPTDTTEVKFVKIQSRLLSDFHHRPIYLRAGVILPRDYNKETSRRYPLWVRIGGLNARYTGAKSFMAEKSEFRKTWLADDSPRMILLQLDGAGPYGDPYQVNSANNGPYGDAITQELIPYVEKNFRAIGEPHARVLSGLSTGGWASLALQIFYPDFFNGTWTFCPDGVDFRAFELVNIYEDANAYTNKFDFERPSDRAINGDTRLSMRREVGIENVLGTGDNWSLSGEQWGAWNATYGPRGADGRPSVLWDPQTGVINHQVAEQWKKYDLRLVLEENWKTLGPKLQGKLHISVGDADNFYLNNGVHLLDEFLSHANPPFKGRIVYGPGKGHGWMDLTLAEMMKEMAAATKPVKN